MNQIINNTPGLYQILALRFWDLYSKSKPAFRLYFSFIIETKNSFHKRYHKGHCPGSWSRHELLVSHTHRWIIKCTWQDETSYWGWIMVRCFNEIDKKMHECIAFECLKTHKEFRIMKSFVENEVYNTHLPKGCSERWITGNHSGILEILSTSAITGRHGLPSGPNGIWNMCKMNRTLMQNFQDLTHYNNWK